MVEESTAASHSLSQETAQLAELIDQFRVGDVAQANLRRELERAAPHAFAKPAALAAKPAAPRVAAKAEPPRTPVKRPKLAAASSSASSHDGWSEF
jgi:methyl-accepting chemotaxis protein